MKQGFLGTAILTGLVLLTQPTIALDAQETEQIEPDAAAVELVNAMIGAMEIADEAARTQALLPLLHPTLLTADGSDIVRNLKMMIGRRLDGFQGFVQPAEFDRVERVHGGHQFGSLQVEAVDRYYAKEAGGGTSMIPIVWSEDGGTPKVVGLPR